MNEIRTIAEIRTGTTVLDGGCYIVRDLDGEVLYVGHSVNYRRRFIDHMAKDSNLGKHIVANMPGSLSWPVELIPGDKHVETRLIKAFPSRFNVALNTELAKLSSAPLVSVMPDTRIGQRFDAGILAGQVRQSTIDLYKRDFRAYCEFAGTFDAALQPSTLAQWRTELASGEKSPNTVNRQLSSVRTLMKAAAEQGYISHETAERFDNVRGVKVAAMRDKLKADARTRIDKEDMRRLCDAPDTSTLAGLMHRALLLTMASSGLRISEVITLTPGQIKAKQGHGRTGYVVYVTGKTDTEAREAPISVEAYQEIEKWLCARPVASGWIFTGFGGRGSRDPRAEHIHPVSAWQIIKRYAAAVGLESIKPHDFRRFVGTTIAKDNPRQAQKILGHKDINTTYRSYVLDELEVGLTDGLF